MEKKINANVDAVTGNAVAKTPEQIRREKNLAEGGVGLMAVASNKTFATNVAKFMFSGKLGGSVSHDCECGEPGTVATTLSRKYTADDGTERTKSKTVWQCSKCAYDLDSVPGARGRAKGSVYTPTPEMVEEAKAEILTGRWSLLDIVKGELANAPA